MRGRLARLLQVRSGDVEASLRVYGGELAYLLAEDPAFRNAFIRQPPPTARAARAAARAPLSVGQLLAQSGSPTLVARALGA